MSWSDAKHDSITSGSDPRIRQGEARLDELQAEKRELDRLCDDIGDFRVRAKAMLEKYQSVYAQHGAHEDVRQLDGIQEALREDCRRAENAILDKRDEIERERKDILNKQDEIRSERRREELRSGG